jgi:hypothetical protein
MKINVFRLGIAGSLTAGITYISIALLLKLWPAKVMKMIGTAHMIPALSYISSYIKVTPAAILMGIAGHMIAAFLFFSLLAIIYNNILKKERIQ